MYDRTRIYFWIFLAVVCAIFTLGESFKDYMRLKEHEATTRNSNNTVVHTQKE